jgi:hypothetical protein
LQESCALWRKEILPEGFSGNKPQLVASRWIARCAAGRAMALS